MPEIDLSPFFPDALRLKDHTGRVWLVQPPSKEDGIIMAALHAQGAAMASKGGTCEACGQVRKGNLSPQYTAALERAEDREIEEVAFGANTYAQMVEAGVPGPVMQRMALYVVWYWTIGKEYADAMIAALAESRDPDKRRPVAGAVDPKAPTGSRKRSKSGRPTGSGSRTSTASTSGTGPRAGNAR